MLGWFCEGGGGCAVDVTVNSLSDRNKSLLAFVLNYEWMGWKFVCMEGGCLDDRLWRQNRF